jgi:hypothetical protein
MFKKSLLALALAGAALSANATTTIGTSEALNAPFKISSQGLPATNAVQLVPTASGDSINFELDIADTSAIVNGSKLVVTISGGFFANDTVTPAFNDADSTGAADDITLAIAPNESTSTQLVFDISGDTYTDKDTITLQDINVILESGSSGVSFSSIFTTGLDAPVASTAGKSKVVATVADQWAAGVVADVTDATSASGVLNADFDVADNRETFDATNADTPTTDTLTFDVETSGSGAVINDVTSTITGDFTGILSVVASNGGNDVTYAINTAKTEATFTYPKTSSSSTTANDVTSATSTVLFTLVSAAADVVALDARDYTISLDIDYNDAEGTQDNFLVLDAAAGGFGLNGQTTVINYMPFGPNTQMIIQATSTFAEDALVTVSYLNETTGKMVTLENVSTAKANAVTKLGGDITQAILDDSGTTSGKTKVVVTINAPAGKVSVFTAFKDLNDADRLAVPNT